ncbi:MAG: Cache 3/Cache 2 fusion domain-containing protein [Candidatus Delongbacteria bacterium]
MVHEEIKYQTGKQVKKVRRYFRKKFINFPTKIRIFLPILLIIIISIAVTTYASIELSKDTLYESIQNNLESEVESLMKMFEREYELKMENAKKDLRVSNEIFYRKGFFIPGEKTLVSLADSSGKVLVDKWYLNNKELHNNFDFVDTLKSILGCKATIFQKTEKGYVRISTNVMNDNDNRAVGTVIEFDSPIAQSIEKGESYFGRAYVVNDWYITGYEPIRYRGETVGMLFVGSKEKDLPVLSKKFNELRIGSSGFPFVFDKTAQMIINPRADGNDWSGLDIIKTIVHEKKGTKRFVSELDGKQKMIAYDYFPDLEYYICAIVNEDDETGQLIRHLLSASLIVSIFILLGVSLIVYFMTIEKLHSMLESLENKNSELASMKEALKHSEKLATMGQLSAGIAHEVNNPLGVVLMYSHILKDECDPDSEMYKDLDTIATQANRCKTILSGLLNFARKNEINKKPVLLKNLINSARSGLIIPGGVDLKLESEGLDVEVELDESQITQVIVNLVNNSIDAIKSEGSIKITGITEKDNAYLIVEDDGPGITEENKKRLFEPFFSTKTMGKGTGLGLAVCYGIVKMHSGKIIVETNPDASKGPTYTRFVIVLPRT